MRRQRLWFPAVLAVLVAGVLWSQAPGAPVLAPPVGGDETTTASLRALLGLDPGAEVNVVRERRYPETRRVVEFTTADGVVIEALWGRTPVRGKAPAVILLHDLRGSREQVADLADELYHAGFSVLAMDLRGHGGSMRRTDGETIDINERIRERRTTVVEEMGRDVRAALDWIDREGRTGYDRHYILGLRMGASVAGRAMSENGTRLQNAVLGSPLLQYFGIDLGKELGSIRGRPYLVFALEGDTLSMRQLQTLTRANDDVVAVTFPGGGPMGNEHLLLFDRPDARARLIEFLRQNEPQPVVLGPAQAARPRAR